MKRRFLHVAGIALAITALAACETGPQKSPIDDASSRDGLQRVEMKGVDAVYRRPGASFAGYNRILLRPVEVSFAKDWKPDASGSVLYTMNKPDREKIKSDLAELFQEVTAEVLSKGGYTIASEADKDVLEVRAAIVNLYITAPDVSMQVSGRSRVYTTDAGQMTLVAETYDSVTGQLLSRAYDRREDSGSGQWQWTTSVSNSAAARQEIRRWADLFKKSLDASRGKTT
jgi:Protein of unknown function (DUF3313)